MILEQMPTLEDDEDVGYVWVSDADDPLEETEQSVFFRNLDPKYQALIRLGLFEKSRMEFLGIPLPEELR